eukprot:878412_1
MDDVRSIHDQISDYLIVLLFVSNRETKEWSMLAILFRCDNQAVCHQFRKKRACNERKDCQALIRDICYSTMMDNWYNWILWLSTKANWAADGLSRLKYNCVKDLPFATVDKSAEALHW